MRSVRMTEPTRTAACKAVLFDLDGTFADTAPDLAYALNCVRESKGQPALPFEAIRPHTSHGANALIKLGFPSLTDEDDFASHRQQLLDFYAENIARETRPFEGMLDLIASLESRNIAWGIVTNKPDYLTRPLMQALELADRAACLISGDSASHPKPHPAPLLMAADLISVPPKCCLYVGDAERDIEAGNRAGMQTLIALFGYLGDNDNPGTWGADGMIQHPGEVLDWL